MLDPRVATFIHRMPKIELHAHLEGSISPSTLLEMARRNGLSLPANDLAGIERLFCYDDFLGFLQVYMICARTLCTGEDFAQLTYEVLKAAAAQNIRYIELFLSSMQHRLRSLDFAELLQGIADGRERAYREMGIQSGIMFDYGRQFGSEEAIEMAHEAVAGRKYGVVAFSIGGDEINYPPALFVEAFKVARAGGLGLTAHAGEAAGAESVRDAVELLGVSRIGHGIRVLEDPVLVEELRRCKVALDVCPTSNVRTGVVRSYDEHPVRRLYNAGLLMTINSDDPTLFGTTLTDEFLLAAERFGFTVDEICGLVQNAVRASFLPPEHKERLLADVIAEQEALRGELGV